MEFTNTGSTKQKRIVFKCYNMYLCVSDYLVASGSLQPYNRSLRNSRGNSRYSIYCHPWHRFDREKFSKRKNETAKISFIALETSVEID